MCRLCHDEPGFAPIDAAALRERIRDAVNGRLSFEGMDPEEWRDVTDAVIAAIGGAS
jgi:hypothetical protein